MSSLRTRTVIHSALPWLGWITLLVGLLIPVGFSVAAVAYFRNLTCTTSLTWTFAPLILGCGPLNSLELMVGWMWTLTCLGALAVAVCAAAMRQWRSRTEDKQARVGAWWMSLTTLGVGIAFVCVVGTNPDAVWGTNSWIFFGFSASLVVYVLAGLARLIFLMASDRSIPAPS